jgi:toxin ParE1/3/4
VGEIKAELEKLVDFPLTGAPREELSSNLRVRFYGFYAIYYIPTEKELIVVRFLHSARDTAAISDRGGFQI